MEYGLLYINLDGFGRYYYDTMPDREKNLPNLTRLIREGTFFEQAYTGIPSITYPMQSAIVSGCYSCRTGNCDKIWDRKQNEVKLLRRKNDAETIGEVLEKEKITTVSIQQFALQDRGCTAGRSERLYVQPGGDYRRRFAVLESLIQDKRIYDGDTCFEYPEFPRAVFLYADDLDAIGHNPEVCRQDTEEKRVLMVQQRLKEIDEGLGRILHLMEEKGLFEKTFFLLTTDHGMVSYQGKSRSRELQKALEQYGFSRVECWKEGKVEGEPDVLLTSHDIQCQVYLPEDFNRQQDLKEYLEKLPYVEQVLTREELDQRGVCREYGDMVVSPKEGACFSMNELEPGRLYASHDSMNEKCQHIFAVLTGPGIKKGYKEERRVQNIDFIPGIVKKIGWPVPGQADGVLTDTIFQ
ncbi:MAG: alkaline phosphatase family protein [Lachnospiraceae bacterium]|nr:alkaline phosphatase family protein [Lachnospiraceae bacterium]